jgi:hypothetical protein
VGDDDWGLGVFKDDGGQFDGGIFGDRRSEDPKDGSTAYVAPIHIETFDYNIVYEHRTDFTVGKLADIRKRFNAMATRSPPSWRFAEDRQHWVVRNATDQGFPLKGAWKIKFGPEKPLLESALACWRSEGAPFLILKIAYTGRPTAGRILWKRLDDDKFDGRKSCELDLVPGTEFHTYSINLATSAEYRGLITGIAIEPLAQARPGEGMAIQSIALSMKPN